MLLVSLRQTSVSGIAVLRKMRLPKVSGDLVAPQSKQSVRRQGMYLIQCDKCMGIWDCKFPEL